MNQPKPTSHDEPLPSYCLRYGWSADPFNIAADKPPYYIPGLWDQLLDVVQHAYQHENSLIAVIGAPGIGKSIFLEQLLLQIDSSTLTSVLNKSPITLDILLSHLSKDLGVPLPAGETFEERFDNQLSSIQLTAQTCLLIIDDADQLPADVLQQLLYFVEQQTDYQMRLHIILLGTPALITLLSQTAATRSKNPKIRYVTLEPFTRQETAAYLLHRIKTIDRHSKVPFSTESMSSIHDNAQGLPQQINVLAKQLLLQGKITQGAKKSFHKKSIMKWVLWILSVLLILIGVSLMAYKYFNRCCSNNNDLNYKANLSANNPLNTLLNNLHDAQLKIPTTYSAANSTYCPLLDNKQLQHSLVHNAFKKHAIKSIKSAHAHATKTKKIAHTPATTNTKTKIAVVKKTNTQIAQVTAAPTSSAKS